MLWLNKLFKERKLTTEEILIDMILDFAKPILIDAIRQPPKKKKVKLRIVRDE